MKRDYNTAQLGPPNDGYRRYHDYPNNNNNNYSMSSAPKPSKQLMSFQNFVRTLNNSVDEATATKKYKEFMADLTQSKVGRFFDANKDREWFRLRYHPIESQIYLQQQNLSFLKRLKIFTDLNDKHYFDTLPFTAKNSTAILNLMDAIIIQLEDGPQELVDKLLSNVAIEPELRQQYIPQKPNSIVVDDIDIETTMAEIQELCEQANPNLLRIAALDPYYVEGGLLKRKVVAIYKHDVDIRETCWRLSRYKLNNQTLSVRINKCLTNRVIPTEDISNHNICILNDIRNAIVLTLNFDELKGLYVKRKQLLEGIKENSAEKVVIKMEVDEEKENTNGVDEAPASPAGSDKSVKEEENEKPFDLSSYNEDKEKDMKKLFEFKFNTDLSLHRQVSKLNKSKNPILNGAHQYLIEFAQSTGARYYLSKVPVSLLDDATKSESTPDDESDKYSMIHLIAENLASSNEDCVKFLDKLLWYLRIVHSFDYYKMAHYKQEDELTHRMSVIHLRSDSNDLSSVVDTDKIRKHLQLVDEQLEVFGQSQAQKYVTKDEERFNYKSYGKVITDELASYSQRIQKPKSTETEEVYKCKHCTRAFQKLSDIGQHFISKHIWAIDAIVMETDFFNAYLFDSTKINPVPPKSLVDMPPNRFARMTNLSQMGEDPDLLQQTIEAYSKMESFVREPAPRSQVESDPRNETIVDYGDISFDDAI